MTSVFWQPVAPNLSEFVDPAVSGTSFPTAAPVKTKGKVTQQPTQDPTSAPTLLPTSFPTLVLTSAPTSAPLLGNNTTPPPDDDGGGDNLTPPTNSSNLDTSQLAINQPHPSDVGIRASGIFLLLSTTILYSLIVCLSRRRRKRIDSNSADERCKEKKRRDSIDLEAGLTQQSSSESSPETSIATKSSAKRNVEKKGSVRVNKGAPMQEQLKAKISGFIKQYTVLETLANKKGTPSVTPSAVHRSSEQDLSKSETPTLQSAQSKGAVTEAIAKLDTGVTEQQCSSPKSTGIQSDQKVRGSDEVSEETDSFSTTCNDRQSSVEDNPATLPTSRRTKRTKQKPSPGHVLEQADVDSSALKNDDNTTENTRCTDQVKKQKRDSDKAKRKTAKLENTDSELRVDSSSPATKGMTPSTEVQALVKD
jgi:hypothetical protein